MNITFSTNLQKCNKSSLLFNLLYLPKIYSIDNHPFSISKSLTFQRVVMQRYSSFQQLYLTRLCNGYKVFYSKIYRDVIRVCYSSTCYIDLPKIYSIDNLQISHLFSIRIIALSNLRKCNDTRHSNNCTFHVYALDSRERRASIAEKKTTSV